MALKAEDYANMGREHAQCSADFTKLEGTPPFPRDKDYWGARAYWEAFDAEVMRLKASAVIHVDPGVSKPRTVLAKGAAWPYDKKTPRGSHIQQLQAQLVEGMPAGRRRRIEAAIVRVKLRDSLGR